MPRATVDGVELAYELQGSGEPVVLIHWGVGTAWAQPLLDEPALADRYRLLSYDRAGFGASSRVDGPIDMATHAAHCAALMRELGIEQAHVVGHSSSVPIALELALAAPDAVRTLVLLEAARPAPPTELQLTFLRTFVQPAVERYRGGDPAAAFDTFFTGVFGRGYRAKLEARLPGAFERSVADADAFFGQELPALQGWVFTEEDARRIAAPALVVVGSESAPTFPERRDLLLSWLPNGEPCDIPGASHLLHVETPASVAEVLVEFFARHPARAAA